MKANIVIFLFACALLINFCSGHDMFKKENSDHLLEQKKRLWYYWYTDQVIVIMWVFAMIVIYPVGAITAFFGYPDLYSSWY